MARQITSLSSGSGQAQPRCVLDQHGDKATGPDCSLSLFRHAHRPLLTLLHFFRLSLGFVFCIDALDANFVPFHSLTARWNKAMVKN